MSVNGGTADTQERYLGWRISITNNVMNYYPTRPSAGDFTPGWQHPQYDPDGFNVASHSRELVRPGSPLVRWYMNSGALPDGCVISGGVVTSYTTCSPVVVTP